MVDEKLPKRLRAAFVTLCLRLWVERHPQQRIPLPRLLRVATANPAKPTLAPNTDKNEKSCLPSFELSPDSPLRHEEDPFYSSTSSDKFFLLEAFVIKYLECICKNTHDSMDDAEGYMLTLAVLEMAHSLIRLGMRDTRDELVEIAGPLLKILDHRTSSHEAKATPAVLSSNVHGSPSAPHPARWSREKDGGEEAASKRKMAAQCKRKLIDVLLQLDDLRVDYRLSLLVHAYGRRRGEEWAEPLGGKDAAAKSNTLCTTHHFQKKVFEPLFETPDGRALE
jgi:hypothetical protein